MTGATNALTEAFPDRVIFGLGVSHRSMVEDLRGHKYDRPILAMATYLDQMDAAPYTAQRPSSPVHRVLAALGPKMLALAAMKSEGAHTYSVTPDHTARARELLGPMPVLCVQQAVILDSDPENARDTARSALSVYLTQPNYVRNLLSLGFSEADLADGGSNEIIDALVAWGDVQTVVERIEQHLDAGADHVCIQPIDGARRSTPAWQWRELAPAMKSLAVSRSNN